jgi:probable LLM family oxidoreductase
VEIAVDSFAALMPDAITGAMPSPTERMAFVLEEIETADRAGIDAFGVGEHHRPEFIDTSPVVILAAAAARTKTILLHSAVTVLSAADPVRVFEDFATLDLISGGRAEIVAGRGSFIEAFPLYGLNLDDYDELYAEKLDLLLKIRDGNPVTWSGRFRPALHEQNIYPRPQQAQLPIWIGVGGTPESFVRAGRLGLPLMVAIIGGAFAGFAPLVDLYRRAGAQAGHPPERLKVGLHAMGFVGENDRDARDTFFAGWSYMFTRLAEERGWHGASRGQFDAFAGPGGAFLVGDPETVAAKMLAASETLGGLARISFQMSAASGNRPAMLRSIELLGSAVAPIVRAAKPEPRA